MYFTAAYDLQTYYEAMLWVEKQQRASDIIIASLHHFYVEQGWPAIAKLEHKI